ncbi:V-set and immunoglobulin domain-containing protein 2 [Bufo bufo]|uniref:V-set and immunoglobulin domain-containing protein 2 n=1 Tax=Bufo bufo TaxID=8384 RepID=UPI001ABE9570|nr:V-set and immunoglobulin domain-containing protein 2 [Bufo bufo]
MTGVEQSPQRRLRSKAVDDLLSRIASLELTHKQTQAQAVAAELVEARTELKNLFNAKSAKLIFRSKFKAYAHGNKGNKLMSAMAKQRHADSFIPTILDAKAPSISPLQASQLVAPVSREEIDKVLSSIPSGWVYSVTVTSPEKIVVGKSSSTVVLPCLYSTTVGNQFVVEWKFLAGNGQSSKWQQIYYFSDGKTYKPGSQADRLTAVQNPPTSGVASIQLTNIAWSDNGTYVCEVNNPPDFSGSGSGIMQLSVLVPPTYPTCQSNGNTITGQDGTLTCSSTGNPPPIYSWSIVGAKTALLPGMMENEITGSLLLTNLSEPMSGTYRCTASNEMGQATCQVTISVSSAGEAGVVAGAVVGVLLALIVIAAILFYLLFYRKKRKDAPKSDHPGNEIREDAVSPMMSDEQRRPRDSHHSRGSQDRSENRARVV